MNRLPDASERVPPQRQPASGYSIHLARGMEGWVDLGYPAMKRPSWRPLDHKFDALTTTPPSHPQTHRLSQKFVLEHGTPQTWKADVTPARFGRKIKKFGAFLDSRRLLPWCPWLYAHVSCDRRWNLATTVTWTEVTRRNVGRSSTVWQPCQSSREGVHVPYACSAPCTAYAVSSRFVGIRSPIINHSLIGN